MGPDPAERHYAICFGSEMCSIDEATENGECWFCQRKVHGWLVDDMGACTNCSLSFDVVPVFSLDVQNTLAQMRLVQPTFSVWTGQKRTKDIPEQPALVFPDENLPCRVYVGDIDDVVPQKCMDRGIGIIVICCPECWGVEHTGMMAQLATNGVSLVFLPLQDYWKFDVVEAVLANNVLGMIFAHVTRHRNVMVVCYGGINRAPAVAAIFMMAAFDIKLCDIYRELVRCRGHVSLPQVLIFWDCCNCDAKKLD